MVHLCASGTTPCLPPAGYWKGYVQKVPGGGLTWLVDFLKFYIPSSRPTVSSGWLKKEERWAGELQAAGSTARSLTSNWDKLHIHFLVRQNVTPHSRTAILTQDMARLPSPAPRMPGALKLPVPGTGRHYLEAPELPCPSFLWPSQIPAGLVFQVHLFSSHSPPPLSASWLFIFRRTSCSLHSTQKKMYFKTWAISIWGKLMNPHHGQGKQCILKWN